MTSTRGGPGLQGQATVAYEPAIYQLDDAPERGRRVTLTGRGGRDHDASVVGMTTSKRLGGTGAWTLRVKRPADAPDLAEDIHDDDWADVVVNVNGKRTHLMRGLVRNVGVEEATREATTRTYVISGEDHQSIFDRTKLWFNQAIGQFGAEAMNELFRVGTVAAPEILVPKLLRGFLRLQTGEDVGQTAGYLWVPPMSAPGPRNHEQALLINTRDVQKDPVRACMRTMIGDPNDIGLWDFASQYAEPGISEFFTDLVDAQGNQLHPDGEWTPENTRMGVIFRGVPFPRLATTTTATTRTGNLSDYFVKIPLTTVQPQEIAASNIGRGGLERVNAIFVGDDLIESDTSRALQPPLWNPRDIGFHGFKPISVQSKYNVLATDNVEDGRMFEMRWQTMCWNALNHRLYNGTMHLGHLRPDIRVGTRILVPGRSVDDQRTFYVETVDHSMNPNHNVTTLGVTRGWVGTDDAYLRELREVVDQWEFLPGYANPPLKMRYQ